MTPPGTALQWNVAAPLVALTAAALVVLMTDLLSRQASRALLFAIGIAGCVASFLVLLPLYGQTLTAFGGAFLSDKFSWTFDALLLFTLAATFLLSSLREAEDGASPASYACLLILCTLGGMIMAGAGNLITFFLGLEQLSLALYVLAGSGYPRTASQEAALKYVLLGSLASGFLIYGSALLYGASGTISVGGLAHAAAVASPLFVGGFALFLVGVAFKLALSPFHLWTPDVYEGAPIAITAYMAVAVKLAVFAFLARLVYTVFGHDSALLAPLWVLAIASMLVGNLGAIRQTNLKRLLAFSSIAQAGYVIVALAGVGSGGLLAMIFYLAAYAFMNIGAFAVIALAGNGNEAFAELDAYRGLFFERPWPAIAMTLFFMSLAGIPVTAGFIGKVLLLGQAFSAGSWGVALALALVAGTIVSIYVYFKVIWQMFVPAEVPTGRPIAASIASSVAVAVGAAGVLVLGIHPQVWFSIQRYMSALPR